MSIEEQAALGQVNTDAAQIYDRFFVPALFGEWAEPLCLAAKVGPGDQVLDVACGTGATTLVAAEKAVPGGAVTGLDRNPGMLAVAREKSDAITFVEAMAEAIPMADDTCDAVLCQFALTFFEDRRAALGEMVRVLRPGGRLALSVWDGAERSPGYAAMIALLQRLFGESVSDALRAPFNLGQVEDLRAVLDSGGLAGARIDTQMGRARFPSIADWVRVDVRGWTLSDMIDDAQYDVLQAEAAVALKPFEAPDGSVSFAAPAHIVSWSKA